MTPLWNDTAPPAPATASLHDDIVSDVAIIGAGILGLCAGVALVESGVRVSMLEAGEIGAGASGRNGGLVVPSLPRIGPGTLAAKLGAARGEALARMVAGSAAATFALIDRLAIDCEARQTGWLNPAHAESLAPPVAARAEAWCRTGAACVWLDPDEARARLGSPHFHGALFDPTGGHVNPLAYTRGLAHAFVAAGGSLFTGSPVLSVSRDGDWILCTGTGRLRAKTILQCTNGQPPGRALRDSTVPLTVFQMATGVVDASIRARILPGDEAFSDTRNNLLACRWTAGGRLVTGGMACLRTGAEPRLLRSHTRRLRRIFPALAAARLERIWSGQASLTGDFVPRLFEIGPGWLAPVACNGRGIALCTVLGKALGTAIASGRLGDFPLPLQPPRPIRPRLLARLAPQILLPLGTLQDRRAERR